MISNMTKLTTSDIVHIANLAQLKLNKEEVTKYRSQLEKVINYIDELSEIDTSETLPTSQTTGLVNKTREDTLGESLPIYAVLSQTKKAYNNYFLVPLILKKKKI